MNNVTWTTPDHRSPFPPDEVALGLEDLACIACEGGIDGDLQERITRTLRTDPRFAPQFEQLEAMRADAGGADLREGLERNQEFDRLLRAGSWENPAEILYPEGPEDGDVDYRKLVAVADARAARAEDPRLILEVRRRLLEAEEERIPAAVSRVADAVRHLSEETAERVFVEVRRRWRRPSRSAAPASFRAKDHADIG